MLCGGNPVGGVVHALGAVNHKLPQWVMVRNEERGGSDGKGEKPIGPIGGALSAVRAQCNYLDVWPY